MTVITSVHWCTQQAAPSKGFAYKHAVTRSQLGENPFGVID